MAGDQRAEKCLLFCGGKEFHDQLWDLSQGSLGLFKKGVAKDAAVLHVSDTVPNASADAAIADVTSILKMKAIPFLDGLLTNDQILELYSSGSVLGFEIDRDEAQLVLAAQSGQLSEVEDLLQRYEQRWLTSGAHKRASDFCDRFRDIYGQPRECSTQ